MIMIIIQQPEATTGNQSVKMSETAEVEPVTARRDGGTKVSSKLDAKDEEQAEVVGSKQLQDDRAGED